MLTEGNRATVEIINITDFVFAPLVGRINFPGHSLTLIVKGTFDLRHGAPVTVADEQLYPTGDEYYPGDGDFKSIRYDSDFAFYKPTADTLLVGKCYAGGGSPIQSCRVTFQVGETHSSLAVFGARYWRPVLKTISSPEPFRVMDICYENSFGGKGYEKNPLGLGYAEIETLKNGKTIPLPKIENINQLINSPENHPDPAGFGPLDRMWQQRSAKLGTYQENWLKERWPWFPVDFSWQYYNAAPGNMQSKEYLKGNETLGFENLHPEILKYDSQLPGLRVRCFIKRSDLESQNQVSFKEVGMNLDTLWVDMEVEKLVLVWRGNTEIQDEDYGDISHLFIVSEQVDDPFRSIEEYHEDFEKTLAADDISFVEEGGPVIAPGPTVSIEEEIKKYQEALHRELLAAGIDPDTEIPELSLEDRDSRDRLLEQYGLNPISHEKSLSRETIVQRIADNESFSKADFTGFNLSGLDLRGGDFTGAVFLNANLENVTLDGAILVEAQFENAVLSGASMRKIDGDDADFTRARLSGADLSESVLGNAIFEESKLDNTILDKLYSPSGYFSGADLSGASLKNGMFDGADFSIALLDNADFSGASLREATVEGAKGEDLVMAGCDLTELRASEGCCFVNGDFRAVTGVESIWEHAELTGADFSFSEMAGADFSSAILKKVDFRGANMKHARFIKADLTAATCVTMNLFESSFEKANLTAVDFSGSNLYGAEFLETKLDNSNFRSANLKMSKLSGKKG
jgi:uncharacterized protein YjbI with pentapeptide repeats